MKRLSASSRLLLFVIGVTVVPIFVGCTYMPKPAAQSEISSNADQVKILNNVKAAIRSMGLIVKEQDPEGGYISAVKGDLSPFTLQVYVRQQAKGTVVEAKSIANYEYMKGLLYSSPEDELPENVVAKFFQALKAVS